MVPFIETVEAVQWVRRDDNQPGIRVRRNETRQARNSRCIHIIQVKILRPAARLSLHYICILYSVLPPTPPYNDNYHTMTIMTTICNNNDNVTTTMTWQPWYDNCDNHDVTTATTTMQQPQWLWHNNYNNHDNKTTVMTITTTTRHPWCNDCNDCNDHNVMTITQQPWQLWQLWCDDYDMMATMTIML